MTLATSDIKSSLFSVDGSASSATLSVADVVVWCGPENSLLRNVVHRFDRHLAGVEELPSPLLFYGGHGRGKSQIVHGLAELWKSQRSSDVVVVTTAADLSRSLSEASKTDDMERFTESYQSAALLVVDDIQQLGGKALAQQWLSQLLDQRVTSARPSLVTCRNSIYQERKLSDRLISRLSGGLAISIRPPLAQTRRHIIEDAVSALALELSDDLIQRLVDATAGAPVPEIQAAVTNLLPISSCQPDGIPELESPATVDLPRRIIRATAKQFGVRVRDLLGPSRRKSIVTPRAVAMFLIRELTDQSLLDVGQHFRRRDHTTVLHAYRKIEKQLAANPRLRETVQNVRDALGEATSSDYWEGSNQCE